MFFFSNKLRTSIIDLIRNVFGPVIIRAVRIIDPWGRQSYSQEGEDLLLARIFDGKSSGFYVDVGAHHPIRFSNTLLFYKKGWRGINIEPNPAVNELFCRARKRDTNLKIGVSNKKGEMLYYEFDDAALNTFNRELAEERERSTSYRVEHSRQVMMDRLESILSENLPHDQGIDFLTIDVEGLDLNVLQSNDWNRFRPHCVFVESLGMDLTPESINKNEIVAYMLSQSYGLFAKTFNSCCFIDTRSDQRPSEK